MKTRISGFIPKIKSAVYELQTYSYMEFQKILPSYLKHGRKVKYTLLDKHFESETGVTLRYYFNQVKAEKAKELLSHYKLSPVEAAYQLGFRSASSFKKVIGTRNRYTTAAIQYPGMYRRPMHMPKYL